MPSRFINSFGNVRQNIDKYRNVIERTLIPSLKDYDIIINSDPTDVKQTSLTYSGEGMKSRIVLKFFSNHVDLQSYDLKEPVLFVNAYFRSVGSPVGIIDLNKISDAAELIYSSLYDLGFRSNKDLEQEELDKQQKAKDDEINKKRQSEKLKSEVDDIVSNANALDAINKLNNEEQDKEEHDKEVTDSINDFSTMFDKYLDLFKQRQQLNDMMSITISLKKDNNVKILSIYLYYVSVNNCLIQTNNIKPEQDTLTTWDKAKNYAINVAKKINGVIYVIAYDENNNELKFEEDNQDDIDSDTDVDVSL